MVKRKPYNALISGAVNYFWRDDPPNQLLEANNIPPTMVAEQQQFTTLLNKVEALTAVVQSLQEVAINNQ